MIDLIRFRSLDLASDTWSFSFSLLTWFSYNFFLTTTTFDSNFSYILVVQETSVSEGKTMFISKFSVLNMLCSRFQCSENNEFYRKIKSPNRPKWILSNFINTDYDHWVDSPTEKVNQKFSSSNSLSLFSPLRKCFKTSSIIFPIRNT